MSRYAKYDADVKKWKKSARGLAQTNPTLERKRAALSGRPFVLCRCFVQAAKG